KDAEELLLAPGEIEAGVLDGQHLRHVAADHPADMDADLSRGGRDRAHRVSFHGLWRTAPADVPPDRSAAEDPRDGRGERARPDGGPRWGRPGPVFIPEGTGTPPPRRGGF